MLAADARAFEKVSGAMAVRIALHASPSRRTTVFLVPEATAAPAKHLAAALLIGNHAHINGLAELPIEEVRPLFGGDLLLVTAAASEFKAQLHGLLVGGQRLTEIWEIESLSKYTSPTTKKPRVFVANPGWILKGLRARVFGWP